MYFEINKRVWVQDVEDKTGHLWPNGRCGDWVTISLTEAQRQQW